jgi:Endonuclease NucS
MLMLSNTGYDQSVGTKMMVGSKARLIYSASKLDFKDTADLVRKNAEESMIQLEVYDTDRLTKSDEDRFLDDIRLVPPQVRGQVRSGGGSTLPISGSSKLNRSIPILIVYDGTKPVDVYPKDLMGVKYDLNSAFKTARQSDTLGVESNLVTILSAKPELLGPGLRLVHREFETGSGIVDMIFKDPEGVFLSVEAKEEADQETVGQVLKQSNGLKDKLGSSSFRKAIVALRTSGNVLAACKDVGIELYLIAAEKQT